MVSATKEQVLKRWPFLTLGHGINEFAISLDGININHQSLVDPHRDRDMETASRACFRIELTRVGGTFTRRECISISLVSEPGRSEIVGSKGNTAEKFRRFERLTTYKRKVSTRTRAPQ